MDASEKLIAEALSKHASDAPSDHDLLSTVHYRLHRRRTGRMLGAAVLAAAVVATAITATHSLQTELRSDPQVARPGPAAPGWRWESYKTVQVQVPATWTQYISGPAPCTTLADQAVPTIGRLNGWLGHTNLYTCSDPVMPLAARQPYVWFDDVQAPGTKQYDAGWTEETRLVSGVKVSVLTKDDAIRRRILDSARPITGTDTYGCTPADPGGPTPVTPADGVTSIDICEYWQGSLVAGSSLPGDRVAEVARRLSAPQSPLGTPAPGCDDKAARAFVMIVHTAEKSWPVRMTYSTCVISDAPSALDLVRDGVHRQRQPTDLFDPAGPVTPPAR